MRLSVRGGGWQARVVSWIAGLAGIWCITVGLMSTAPQAQSPTPTPPAGEFKPPPAPVQPINFSHRLHARTVGVDCADCHVSAQTADRATLPPTETCMGCHALERTDAVEIQKLTGFATRKEAVPWRRVYRLPEYVWFSHQTHLASDKAPKISCTTCHGDVANAEVIQKVRDTSMAACTECHKQYTAPVLCDSCHEKL